MRQLVAVVALSILVAAPAVARAQSCSVAVLELEADGAARKVAGLVTAALRDQARRAPGVCVVPGGPLSALRLAFGCLDESPACVAQVGGSLGVARLVFGAVRPAADGYAVTVKHLDVARRRIDREHTFQLPRRAANAKGVQAAAAGWLPADDLQAPAGGSPPAPPAAAASPVAAPGPTPDVAGEVRAAPPRAPGLQRLYLGPRVGAVVPFAFYGAGYEAGAELQYRLPLAALGHRVRASLYFGVTQVAGRESRLFPGRGLEPAFVENVTTLPLEVMGHVEVWRTPRHALTLGVGYTAFFTRSEVAAFGTTSHAGGVGHAFAGGAAYRLRLAVGEIAVAVRADVGNVDLGHVNQVGQLGPVGKAGTQGLSAVAFTLAYLHGFLSR